MKPVPGICDRCGQRFALSRLRWEYVLGKNTGVRACPKCIDISHPQLDTRNLKTNDKQSVPNSRSDIPELEESRRMFAWNPVGTPLTSTATVSIGRVMVTTGP